MELFFHKVGKTVDRLISSLGLEIKDGEYLNNKVNLKKYSSALKYNV